MNQSRQRLKQFRRAAVRLIALTIALVTGDLSHSAECYKSMIKSPAPFMGNNDEIFVLEDSSVWEVKYEYEYMYEYYPSVTICPDRGKLIIGEKVLNVAPVSTNKKTAGSKPSTQQRSARESIVVLKVSGCRGYFLADGPQGYYLLQWYGGHEPEKGEVILGDIGGYGFKEVYYPEQDAQGRVYVDNYLLSRDRAIEKYADKCN